MCDGFVLYFDTANLESLLKVAMTSTSDVPARPNQLTVNFLQNILQDSYPSHRVINFKWEPMNLGVIADVVIITVEIESKGENDKAKRMKIRLVGKFMRLEIPFESMFVVESNFYKAFAAKTGDLGVKISAALDDFPFAIPAATFASSKLIILDYVEPVRTYTCVEGSPQHMISMLVTKLAQMHARYWNHSCNGLATPAGIGSQLTGEEKRLQFPSCWKVYLNDVSLESSDMARIIVLCQRLSQNPNLLERVHEMVESGPSCFIHGDFHIANMLLPTDDTEDERTWLLDWATCGRGNPMRDLAFFFIVSVKAIHRRAQEAQCQQKYFDTLTAEIEAVHFTMDELRWQYKVCVLNQFLIFVVYDSLTKSLVTNAKSEKLRGELDLHFREVNRRMCLSLLDNIDEKEFQLLDARRL